MKDYSKTKRIPLEEATKEELIVGIKAIGYLYAIEQAEKAIYWARQQNLIDEIGKLIDKVDRLRSQDEAYHPVKVVERLEIHKQISKLNEKLSKLQGA